MRAFRGPEARPTCRVANTFVCRHVSMAETTPECQTRQGDEFMARFYCVIKGVGYWLVLLVDKLLGLFNATGRGWTPQPAAAKISNTKVVGSGMAALTLVPEPLPLVWSKS